VLRSQWLGRIRGAASRVSFRTPSAISNFRRPNPNTARSTASGLATNTNGGSRRTGAVEARGVVAASVDVEEGWVGRCSANRTGRND